MKSLVLLLLIQFLIFNSSLAQGPFEPDVATTGKQQTTQLPSSKNSYAIHIDLGYGFSFANHDAPGIRTESHESWLAPVVGLGHGYRRYFKNRFYVELDISLWEVFYKYKQVYRIDGEAERYHFVGRFNSRSIMQQLSLGQEFIWSEKWLLSTSVGLFRMKGSQYFSYDYRVEDTNTGELGKEQGSGAATAFNLPRSGFSNRIGGALKARMAYRRGVKGGGPYVGFTARYLGPSEVIQVDVSNPGIIGVATALQFGYNFRF